MAALQWNELTHKDGHGRRDICNNRITHTDGCVALGSGITHMDGHNTNWNSHNTLQGNYSSELAQKDSRVAMGMNSSIRMVTAEGISATTGSPIWMAALQWNELTHKDGHGRRDICNNRITHTDGCVAIGQWVHP